MTNYERGLSGIAEVESLPSLNCSVVAGQLGSETGRALQGDLSGKDVFHSKMAEHLAAAQTFALRSPTRCVGQRGTGWEHQFNSPSLRRNTLDLK